MNLSSVGVIADILWYEIKNHAKNVELGEFVVMPNHVHGVIILNGNETGGGNRNGGHGEIDGDGGKNVDDVVNIVNIVETRHALSLQYLTDPRDPNQPNPRDPNQPNPHDPNQPNQRDPTQPNPRGPNQPNPRDPNQPNPHDPNRPDPQPPTPGQQRFQNQGKNTVSSIIGAYKSAVSKHAHRLHFNFAWQPRFYDHIIRDEESFMRISTYIVNNPLKWKDDKFFKK